MLTTNMSSREMLVEFERDYLIIAKRIEAYVMKHLKTKIMKIWNRTHQAVPKKDTIKMKVGNNTYYIIASFQPYPGCKTGDLMYCNNITYTILENFESGQKNVVYFPTPGESDILGGKVLLYESHFIKRYRERFLGVGTDEISFLEVVDKMLRRNHTTPITFHNNPKYPDLNLESCMEDGVGFGRIGDSGIMRFITFISMDMLRDYQVPRVGEGSVLDQSYQEYLDFKETCPVLPDVDDSLGMEALENMIIKNRGLKRTD